MWMGECLLERVAETRPWKVDRLYVETELATRCANSKVEAYLEIDCSDLKESRL
jgi:hypothetical protein